MIEVTVAICAYNCDRYIKETLECIKDQTFQDFHLWIVNDCSTDNTKNLIEIFFHDNPRQYTLTNFPKNYGLAVGRHYIEEHATTKYILFIDSDDCPHTTLIEKLYNVISNDEDLMAVGCYHEFIDSKGRRIGGGIFMGETTKEGFYRKAKECKLIFMQPTAIINRELVLSVGGRNINGFPHGKPRYQDLCEDLDLWTRMSDLYNKGKAIIVIPEVLCKYRKHESSMSSNSFGMILRMRHIKINLLRRRGGENELTFIDFLSSLSEKELKSLHKKAQSAEMLREGILKLRKWKVILGIVYLSRSVWLNPKYFWQKIMSNSGVLRLL